MVEAQRGVAFFRKVPRRSYIRLYAGTEYGIGVVVTIAKSELDFNGDMGMLHLLQVPMCSVDRILWVWVWVMETVANV